MNKMILSKMRLNNYKNIKIQPEGLQLNNLNIFVGPNGSGKSNLINVLKFLKNALISNPDNTGKITEFEKAVIELGDFGILDATLTLPSSISFKFQFASKGKDNRILYLNADLLVKGNDIVPSIIKESFFSISKSEKLIYYDAHVSETGKGIIFVKDNSLTGSKVKNELFNIPVNRFAFNSILELLEKTDLPPDSTPFYSARREIIDTVGHWRFYNANTMNLKNIRESEPKIGPADIFLDISGENLALVFDNLNQKYIDFEEKINLAIKEILPLTRKIRTVRSGRFRLAVEYYMEGMNKQFYLNDMSDGTVRMLCWALVLLSPEPPSLLFIDEPEIGLHPAWMRTLAQWIKHASERTQVVVITHSPDLLDHFTDCYKDVICFEYDGKKHFTAKKLPENLLKSKFKDDWELGDLYRVGDPAVGGWPW